MSRWMLGPYLRELRRHGQIHAVAGWLLCRHGWVAVAAQIEPRLDPQECPPWCSGSFHADLVLPSSCSMIDSRASR